VSISHIRSRTATWSEGKERSDVQQQGSNEGQSLSLWCIIAKWQWLDRWQMGDGWQLQRSVWSLFGCILLSSIDPAHRTSPAIAHAQSAPVSITARLECQSIYIPTNCCQHERTNCHISHPLSYTWQIYGAKTNLKVISILFFKLLKNYLYWSQSSAVPSLHSTEWAGLLLATFH